MINSKRFLVPGWRMGWIVIHDRKNAFSSEVDFLFVIRKLFRVVCFPTITSSVLDELESDDRIFVGSGLNSTRKGYCFSSNSIISPCSSWVDSFFDFRIVFPALQELAPINLILSNPFLQSATSSTVNCK